MCDLQRFVKDLTEAVLYFRLDLCCFVFSVRAGILLCGYFNVITDMICLIAVSTEVLPPMMMNVQQSYMEGEYIKSSCAFAYSADLCLAVHLLCAMYRKDIVLLRYYTYCGMAMLASTLLVYSMVIGVMSVLHTCMLAVSLTYQVYIILLVRSVIVELKQEEERLEYLHQNYPVYWKHDIEAPGNYPLEIYEINSPVSSRRNSGVRPSTLNVPMLKDNETVEAIELKDINEPKVKEIKGTVETKNEVKDNVKPKPSEVNDTERKSSKPEDQPTTSKTTISSKTEVVSETFEKPKALRYPYKFIAIKVPKEKPIKEEKETEEKEKETEIVEVKEETNEVAKGEETKDIVKENETKEVIKETKKPKRSIFGRKKSKSDDGKTKDGDKKN